MVSNPYVCPITQARRGHRNAIKTAKKWGGLAALEYVLVFDNTISFQVTM